MDPRQNYQRDLPHHSSPWAEQSAYASSQHPTPDQNFMGFSWPQPPPFAPGTENIQTMSYQQVSPQFRQNPQFDPETAMALPLWPSQIGPARSAAYKVVPGGQPQLMTPPAMYHNPTDMFAQSFMTGPDAAATTPTPRRTLTDDDRKQMCLFAEEHPTAKQTEIGARFKVDRSTVSKVLRQKEKYLKSKSSRPSPKRGKSRKGDVEKALHSWASKQKRPDLTDEAIIAQAAHFAAPFGGSSHDPTKSKSWMKKFKHQYAIEPQRVDSAVTEDPESGSQSESESSDSPSLTSMSPPPLHTVKSEDDLQSTVSDHISDSASPFNLPMTSLDTALVSDTFKFDPDTFSPPETYMHHASNSISTDRPIRPASDRPRRKTFPDTWFSPKSEMGASTDPSPKFPSLQFDSPMDEYNPLGLLNSPSDLLFGNEVFDQMGETVAPSDLHSTSTRERGDLNGISPRKEEKTSPKLKRSTTASSIPTTTISQSLNQGRNQTQNQVSTPPSPEKGKKGTKTKRPLSISAPSREDARSGLETAWRYFEGQPKGFLDSGESMLMGRMIEKLKRRGGSIG